MVQPVLISCLYFSNLSQEGQVDWINVQFVDDVADIFVVIAVGMAVQIHSDG